MPLPQAPKAFPKQEQWDGSKATGEAFEGNVRGWKAVNVQHPDANSPLAQDPVWLLGVLSSTAAVPASPFASWERKHGDAVRARHKEDWLAAGGSVAAYRGQALLGAGGKEVVPHLVEYWVEQALAAMRGSYVAALVEFRAFQLQPGEEARQAWHCLTTLARRVPAELATPVEQGQLFLKAIHPDLFPQERELCDVFLRHLPSVDEVFESLQSAQHILAQRASHMPAPVQTPFDPAMRAYHSSPPVPALGDMCSGSVPYAAQEQVSAARGPGPVGLPAAVSTRRRGCRGGGYRERGGAASAGEGQRARQQPFTPSSHTPSCVARGNGGEQVVQVSAREQCAQLPQPAWESYAQQPQPPQLPQPAGESYAQQPQPPQLPQPAWEPYAQQPQPQQPQPQQPQPQPQQLPQPARESYAQQPRQLPQPARGSYAQQLQPLHLPQPAQESYVQQQQLLVRKLSAQRPQPYTQQPQLCRQQPQQLARQQRPGAPKFDWGAASATAGAGVGAASLAGISSGAEAPVDVGRGSIAGTGSHAGLPVVVGAVADTGSSALGACGRSGSPSGVILESVVGGSGAVSAGLPTGPGAIGFCPCGKRQGPVAALQAPAHHH